MKRILFLTACLMGSGVLAENEKPNILFIFADDMSYETIGAHGMLDIDTPNLDTLVERGTSFTHAYNMGAWHGAVCVASRRMLNVGKFVWHAKKSDLEQLVSEEKMWSQRMSAAGYRTYMSGKWHVPTSAPDIFDVSEHVRPGMPKQTDAGYHRPKDEADYEQGWKPWETEYGGYWKGGKHWSEVLADDSIEFLEQAAKDDQPFFMYLAFNAPHDPRQAPKEYIDRYPLDRIKVPENFLPEYPYAEEACGKQLRDEKLMPYPRTEYAVKVNRQEYFALITHMDDQIGKIFQALEKTGQAENTYIFFTADHGLAVGHHGFVGKQNMYDHSVRPPFLMVGPGVKAGSKIDAPIYLQDVMPTSLELAGTGVEEVDFQSLIPLIQGKTSTHYDSIYGAYKGNQRMITQGDWKLIVYPNIGIKRLYNLKKDSQEMNDLAANPEYKKKLEQLSAALENEMDAQDDPISSLAAAEEQHQQKVIQQGADKALKGQAKMPWRKIPAPKGATVDVETASSANGFSKLPVPAASGRTVTANQKTNNDPLKSLADGRLAEKIGPVFANGVDNGAYKMDLGSVQSVAAITSWSFMKGSRGRQKITLYGSDSATDPGWDLSKFTPLCTIDTTGSEKDKYTAASLRADAGQSLGKFRWIVWAAYPVTGKSGGENTAFQELAVELVK